MPKVPSATSRVSGLSASVRSMRSLTSSSIRVTLGRKRSLYLDQSMAGVTMSVGTPLFHSVLKTPLTSATKRSSSPL